MPTPPIAPTWTRIPIAKIEDLSDAVYGAGLEATQVSSGKLSGGLAFSEVDGISCSSGLIDGCVTLYGPLSSGGVTLGIGVDLAPGSRQWMHEVGPGNVGVFLPGDEHDSLHMPGSIYASITLSHEKLEHEAAKLDLILDRKMLGGTGKHARDVPWAALSRLQSAFRGIHTDRATAHDGSIAKFMLHTLILHLARPPHLANTGANQGAYAKVVARARAYIHEHLAEPISIDDVAAAAFTSRRTLLRAFADILNDTPRDHVRRLRLHRIRHDLASDRERSCTIALVANDWGMNDLGRMAGWYRELFGELPSQTHSQVRAHRKLA